MAQMPRKLNIAQETELDKALKACKGAFHIVFWFSFAVNLLMLAMPIYSLQVLDRVLSSGSLDTLMMLTLLILGIFLVLGVMESIRSFVLMRIGEWLEQRLAGQFFENTIAMSAVSSSTMGTQSLRDLATIKGFITNTGINSLFDAPWSVIYITVIFLIHPLTGMVSLAGAVILFLMALFNDYSTRKLNKQSSEESIKAMRFVELSTRNSEVIEAMGMRTDILKLWQDNNAEAVRLQTLANYRAAIILSVTKVTRMVLQIVILGVGAYLALQNQNTFGGIIACSILMGRALAPFEASIQTWKSLTIARMSYLRLKQMLLMAPKRNESIKLPEPKGMLSVERLLYAPPNSNKPIIKGISFVIQPGEVLGMIGPSASGKTTLSKLIVGVYQPSNGIVRLDGANVYTWNRDDFGHYVGYLPQDVELFHGSVKDNIARMKKDVAPEAVVEAAQIAGAHDMILRLPEGYETQVGAGGTSLSAGQRQRVGLARAFFGNPKLIVLDEPNANLDDVGEFALVKAIQNAKTRGITTIVVSHRPSILSFVDKILVMDDGTIRTFGPREEVMEQFAQNAKRLQQQQQAAKQQPPVIDNGPNPSKNDQA